MNKVLGSRNTLYKPIYIFFTIQTYPTFHCRRTRIWGTSWDKQQQKMSSTEFFPNFALGNKLDYLLREGDNFIAKKSIHMKRDLYKNISAHVCCFT